MSRRQLQRRREKAQRHAAPLHRVPAPPLEIVREATHVDRLAYTRTQAAEALGVSRSTFNRRILPLVETVEMPWGARLIPIDELQRLIAERRRPARARNLPAPSPGRRATVAPNIVGRIRPPPAGVWVRSCASSTPTRYRQHTVARSGGRRPCALYFADPLPDP